MQEPDYDAQLDQEVTLTGTAHNARAGAIVLTEDQTPIYLDGISTWDDDAVRKTVEVRGILRRRSLLPLQPPGPHGEISQGIEGDSLVLERPTWTIKG